MPHHTPRKFTHKEMIDPQYEKVVDVMARAQNTAFEYREREMFEPPLSSTMDYGRWKDGPRSVVHGLVLRMLMPSPLPERLLESCERISPCHIP
jgi:hypothetical protein